MNEWTVQQRLAMLERHFLFPTLLPLMLAAVGLMAYIFSSSLTAVLASVWAGTLELLQGVFAVKAVVDRSLISLFVFLGLTTVILMMAREQAQRLTRALSVAALGEGDYAYLVNERARAQLALLSLQWFVRFYGVAYLCWAGLTFAQHGDVNLSGFEGASLALTLAAGAAGLIAQWSPLPTPVLKELASSDELAVAAMEGAGGATWFSGSATEASMVELPRVMYTVLRQRIPRLLPASAPAVAE